MRKGPFKIRGADNYGLCYFVKDSLFIDGQSPIFDPKILGPTNLTYFDDPDLTFDDSIVYGCKLRLNYNELSSFTNNQQW